MVTTIAPPTKIKKASAPQRERKPNKNKPDTLYHNPGICTECQGDILDLNLYKICQNCGLIPGGYDIQGTLEKQRPGESLHGLLHRALFIHLRDYLVEADHIELNQNDWQEGLFNTKKPVIQNPLVRPGHIRLVNIIEAVDYE